MKPDNKFYVFRDIEAQLISGYTFDLVTGEVVSGSGAIIPKMNIQQTAGLIRVYFTNIQHTSRLCLQWDQNNNYLGYTPTFFAAFDYTEFKVFSNTKSIAILFVNASVSKILTIQAGFKIVPHYQQLKKVLKKENGQMFFRESLDGRIKLFGSDYEIVKNSSLEDTLYFYVYRNDALYASASFNRSDCKLDNYKKSVELKLTYKDKYTKVLNSYENTYDLIKLAPALTRLTLTKRCVVQIYIQNDKTISNYAGGTYWETDVNEQIDNEDALLRRYYFSKGPKYVEVDLEGFNYNINAAFSGISSSNIWNSVSKVKVDDEIYEIPCSIKFNKIANAGESVYGSIPAVHLLSTGDGNGLSNIGSDDNPQYEYTYDTYQIEIYTGLDGTGSKIYQSVRYYGKDKDFTLSAGEGLYPMTRIEQPVPALDPTPNTFFLGENVIEYQIWGRILCDVDTITDGQGNTVDTYDLPYDDFATARRNYKKCIGLRGFDSVNSVVSIWQTNNSINTPTSYGMNDYGEYFMPPYTIYGQYFYPLAKSSWANTSLWVRLGSSLGIASFEDFCAEHYREYTLKNAYHISDVIKVLLDKIDPSLRHEHSAEYSSFLYGHSGGTASALGNCDIYITQKTNILKGEYDQAAQKAEIKFKQLMEMLRDCFRCYWFIDDQNRFRIEHVSYFINGFSYNNSETPLDLTSKYDIFNKKTVLYCQREIDFDKSDLASRYEFAYMDDVTKVMGGDLYIDVNNAYIQKDKTEEINVDGFTADIDYMLFLPDDFSNEGFALLMANGDKKVPIVNKSIKDEKQSNHNIEAYIQNWYASFNQLVYHYMKDISGNNVNCNNTELHVDSVKRCVKHSIEFSNNTNADIDIYKLIISDEGSGYIEEMTENIDTNLISVELRYEPS